MSDAFGIALMENGLLRSRIKRLETEIREFLGAAHEEGLPLLWSNGELWLDSLAVALSAEDATRPTGNKE